MPASGKSVISEAVGYFRTPESLQAAIDAQMSAGFDHAELSRTWDARDEKRAVDIMKQHSGQDVHGLPSAL